MRKVLLAVLSMSFLLCAGCGSSTSFEEDMIKKYKENNRIERYYELNDDYDGNRLILLLNSEENHPVLNVLIRGCPACFLILKGVVISSHETNRFS